MSSSTKVLVADAEGKLIPQYFNKVSDQYEPLNGRGGGMLVNTVQNPFRDDFPGTAIDATKWTVTTGAGHTVAVANSVLSIATGTTINTETIIKSVQTFTIPFRAQFIMYLSQRIANQEFYVELVNAAGDMQAYWKFDGATATYGKYGGQNAGTTHVSSDVTVLTTASYAIKEIECTVDETYYASRYVDSTNSRYNQWVKQRNIPDPLQEYYIRIRAKNLGTAPASTTTMYVDAILVQDITELTAEITGGRGNTALSQAIPVYQTGSAIVAIAGTAAHDAAISGAPLRIGARALTADYTAVSTGDVADLKSTLTGALITKEYAIPELEQSFACTAPIAVTTDTAVFAAGAAGIKNYITTMQLINTSPTVGTEVVLKDGATTVLWRGYLPANQINMLQIEFDNPLKTTAATALNFACITAGANVYVNAQGYKAP